MDNAVHKLLHEFSIRMNDRPENPEEEEDEFDFDLKSDSKADDLDFDRDELEFGDFEPPEDEDEFGNYGHPSNFPDGLDDVDDEDGEFGGERKVDITDRLKSLLARRGETEDDLDSKMDSPELNLSDIDDLSSNERPSRRMRGHDDMETPDRLGRVRRDRMERRHRGTMPTPEVPSKRDR